MIPKRAQKARSVRWLAIAVLAAVVAGCTPSAIPDPNDPNDVGNAQPEVLRNDLKGAADSLYERVAKGELTDAQAQGYLAKYADELLSGLKIEKVPHDKAWEYAEVFRTARRWKQAKVFLEIAVKYAKNQDRSVNDSIRLAAVDCQLGDVPEAIKLVRSTFGCYPENKAPILIGTLLEVVPAGRGKGHDLELAKLLEDAIPQAIQTRVDESTIAGKSFLIARNHHISNAWTEAIQLYNLTGHPDLARKAELAEAEYFKTRRAVGI